MRKRNRSQSDAGRIVRNATEELGVLREVKAKDEWQSVLMTSNDHQGGVVVRNIIEPTTCMVRYLVVYRQHDDNHLLVPATTVIGGELGVIYVTLSDAELNRLPTYDFDTITRADERLIYALIQQTPYWIEETAGT